MKGDVQRTLKLLSLQALVFLSLFFSGFTWNSFCSSNTGYKYVDNYPPDEYLYQPQNWAILQDEHGLIYVGNHGGLLEFDGVAWRKIEVPNKTVRSLAIDDKGTVFIGGINEIGCLVPDELGTMQYQSLLSYIPQSKRYFSTVWKTLSTKNGVYFGTYEYLFYWDRNSNNIDICQEAAKPNLLKAFFLCRDNLYIRKGEIGLMKLKGKELELIPGGDMFADDGIFMMVPYDKSSNRILIGSRTMGFYIYDPDNGNKPVRFSTQVEDYVIKHKLHHGIRLSSGNFALATLSGGLVIIDPEGHRKYLFNKDYGLQDDSVKYVFEDLQNNIWLGFEIGISKIEYNSPVSMYDNKRSNLPGLVQSVIRHGVNNTLYAGTTRGLFTLSSGKKFKDIPGLSGVSCWSLLSVGHSLLTATEAGIVRIESDHIKKKIYDDNSYALQRSSGDKNRIWVGTETGLISLYRNNKTQSWAFEYRFKNVKQVIRTIVEDNKGNLWLGITPKGVLKINFSRESIDPEVIPRGYGNYDGLPSGEVHVYFAGNRVWFATTGGLYSYNEKEDRFKPDYRFGERFTNGNQGIWRIAHDKHGDIWYTSKNRTYRAVPKPGGSYEVQYCSFLSFLFAQVNTIYPDPGGEVIWFARQDGLLSYDTRIKDKANQDFSALIRRVLVNGKPILSKYRCEVKTDNKSGHKFPLIPYKDRNLRIEFAAPFFLGETINRYQHYLEGYDDHWSDWSYETRKDYTNLDSGNYTFKVRARNSHGTVSKEDVFRFRVLPPWFQTWWAILFYITITFLLVYSIVKWRSWRLHQEKQKLETIIKDRTKEINQKNQQLEQQTTQLQEQSERLKEIDHVKSRFFANISHEFRTPLTLIMGPLEQMLSERRNQKLKSKLNLMMRSALRLLNLINQLLELSKLDSGKMKLQASGQNIVLFLKGILDSFQFLILQNKLELTFHTDDDNIFLYFDAEKLEKVICNLLSNAIKFTPEQGKISVTLKQKPPVKEIFPEGFVEIAIADSGIGIPQEQLPYVFDRFYQARVSTEHEQKGSGIGLALTKELITLHYGRIEVESSKNNDGKEGGTTFSIHLPLGKDHLQSHEIIGLNEKETNAKKTCEVPVIFPSEKEDEEVPVEVIDPEAQEKDIILVVEDSADVRRYIREPLNNLYSVVEAVNGKEGIDKAKEIIPDLIISDIMMPELDGYELCQNLKKEVTTSHIPIILLTAKASEDNIVQGLEIGADDYITKPFNTKILMARIKNLIDLRRQVQQKIKRQMMMQPEEISVSSLDEEFLKDLQKVIEKNLSDPEFSVEELGRKLYLSRATLYRKIQALSGESPNQFIRSYRLKRAAQLLKEQFGNITEIAFQVGFSSSAYFTKCFKEQFHQLPSAYQASEGFGSSSSLS